jgi:hypothetical protein
LTDISPPDRQFEFVNDDKKLEQRAHTWMDDVTKRLNEGQNLPTLEGIGSPEAVINSIKDRLYRDTAANDFYIKTTDSGDTGWILI